jgi:AcrR family transcriptional regulator
MADHTDTSIPRGRGRPRKEGSDEELLAAARRLLGNRRYGELTVEDIAREAGVAKTSLYRRWPSKAALAADAVRGERDLLGGDMCHVVASLIGEAQENDETREIVAALLAPLRSDPRFEKRLARLLVD